MWGSEKVNFKLWHLNKVLSHVAHSLPDVGSTSLTASGGFGNQSNWHCHVFKSTEGHRWNQHIVFIHHCFIELSSLTFRNEWLETRYKSNVRNTGHSDPCCLCWWLQEFPCCLQQCGGSLSRSRQALVHELLLDETHPPLRRAGGLGWEVRGVSDRAWRGHHSPC